MLLEALSVGTAVAAAVAVTSQVKAQRARSLRLKARQLKREEHDRLWQEEVLRPLAKDESAS